MFNQLQRLKHGLKASRSSLMPKLDQELFSYTVKHASLICLGYHLCQKATGTTFGSTVYNPWNHYRGKVEGDNMLTGLLKAYKHCTHSKISQWLQWSIVQHPSPPSSYWALGGCPRSFQAQKPVSPADTRQHHSFRLFLRYIEHKGICTLSQFFWMHCLNL